MRAVWLAIATVAACKGEKTETTAKPSESEAPAKLDLVRVDDDRAVVDPAVISRPIGVAWIDGKGQIEVAQLDDKWPKALPATARSKVPDPRLVSDALRNPSDPTRDDPPPPPEEDKPDDGDESGGTGTAMVLEEGKMGQSGKKDRAEGQGEAEQLARRQAIEQARKAGILGASVPHRGAFASLGGGDGDGLDTVTAAMAVEELPSDPIVVAAVPGAPAAVVVRAIASHNSNTIALAHRGKLAVLAIAYGRKRPPRVDATIPPGIELHVAPDGLHVVDARKPDQTVIAWQDRDALRAAYTRLAGDRQKADAPPVDVFVAPGDVTAQQLVDLLAALRSAGVMPHDVGVLAKPSDARITALKQAAVPSVSIGQPATVGDLDKSSIRASIKASIDKIRYCYEKQLIAKPTLQGTVQVQFLITGIGQVAAATATGVDPAVSSCVAEVIKKITFDKPKNGGNVQVNYPFTFRPGP